jgi:signal peptidase
MAGLQAEIAPQQIRTAAAEAPPRNLPPPNQEATLYAPPIFQAEERLTPAPLPLEELLRGDFPSVSQPQLSSEPGWSVLPSPALDSREEGKPLTPARRILRAISDLIFWVVCISLVAGSILFASSEDPRKSYFGYRSYNVLTESMTPKEDGSSQPGGFRKGAMILVRMCNPEDVKIGDIITFNPNARDTGNAYFLTHRVVDIKYELGGKEGIFFVTRGDHNNADDSPISGDMLIGKKIFHIPELGTWLEKMRQHFVIAIITIVCFFACLLLLRWYFAAPKQGRGAGGLIPG